jgi:protein TonB
VHVRITATPALKSWEAPREESIKRRILLPGLAVAAVLVVTVVLWLHRSTSAETAPPAIPIPAAVAVTLPAATPVETPAPPVAKSESAVKSAPAAKPAVEEHSQPKPAKTVETQAVPPPKPQPVIEIAAAQPKPKVEPEPEMPAPKLAPAANDAAVANLGKVHVALPVPPKSELVAATLVSRVAPIYPAVARQMGISGLIVMNVTIAPGGTVSAVRVTDGAMQLRSAAADAVRQWRYKPATLNGKPVESSAQVQVNFTR